jgi:hypothetical protein
MFHMMQIALTHKIRFLLVNHLNKMLKVIHIFVVIIIWHKNVTYFYGVCFFWAKQLLVEVRK